MNLGGLSAARPGRGPSAPMRRASHRLPANRWRGTAASFLAPPAATPGSPAHAAGCIGHPFPSRIATRGASGRTARPCPLRLAAVASSRLRRRPMSEDRDPTPGDPAGAAGTDFEAFAPAAAAPGRPSWSGLLHVGLLAVPVQAYPAVV